MNSLLVSLITPLGVVGLLSVMYTLYILANFSQRLGAVTKIKPYYRGFYVAMGFLAIALLARVTYGSLAFSLESSTGASDVSLITLAAYYIPFVIAIVISVAIAWHYWNWLFKEKLS